jgi:hypothetical protein
LYAKDINIILYMLRNMRAGTYHGFNGNMFISAYNSQMSARALYSIRVSPQEIRPVNVGTAHGVPHAGLVHADAEVTNKTKFIVWLYILQKLDQPTVVAAKNANRMEVGRLVLRLFGELVEDHLLPDGLLPPCAIQTVIVETHVANRPGIASTAEEVVLTPGFPMLNLANITTDMLVGPEALFSS